MKEDISKILVVLPEEWNRTKKQYVRLILGGDGKSETSEPVWLGRKHDYTSSGNKARVEYSESDIAKIDNAPDSSTIQVRNERGLFKFQKKEGKWVQITEI